ncbi:hypothetical protein ACFQFC_39695 [Amorphoplanes digitatis]|uniref:Uncharacterized protein n=1 Tax=Actinoplanes digitatis TaxID=1868 RepID=A0A7W7HWX7_9ACTN|nr:hypothetical protein [Actinoplanes digitatis]MBB4762298.1 hypothetical protein [Actinoplanes digitatis]GID92580.1 hypothetical protein Adi01nite_19920 [Actinoplanes digitatis]
MSYDMLVMRFEHGEPAPMPGTAFRAAFEACIDRTEPEFHYWHVTAPDGGDASLYGGLTDDQLGSILFNRFSTGAVLDLLATFLNLAGAVVIPPDRPTMLADEAQREHLPEELRTNAVVVRSGADMESVIAEAPRPDPGALPSAPIDTKCLQCPEDEHK